MSLILGMILVVALYLGGRVLGHKIGADSRAWKISLGVAVLAAVVLLASFVAPQAVLRLAPVAMLVFPLALGTYRGSKNRAAQGQDGSGGA
jgi:hypothetical protein